MQAEYRMITKYFQNPSRKGSALSRYHFFLMVSIVKHIGEKTIDNVKHFTKFIRYQILAVSGH
jgi:hypothetical protein